ncbi:acetyl-CoA C-acyltransferase [Marivita sp. S6314]|uniref:acetyl-CoA C-acyltransferase n=1 Tax=Marivita sp. S6314 TaxID=2926406 RepID=UPI001FF5CE3D|nr:acetyl-CoA C-acyltransferase [Marivita sp. S6314]MCK0151338.1 acetyl-CoA C-acyltransferase [Marivita sp. S6314]
MKPVIIDAIRTPRGRGTSKGGSLSEVRSADLLAGLFTEMSERHPNVETLVDDTVIGCVTQVGDQGSNIGKVASLRANWPASVPGATINRFCASGLSAVNAVAAQAQVHDSVVLGGGVEMMSRTAMFADNGVMFADKAFGRSIQSVHPVLGADLVASLHGISREDCDAYAALSQNRAEAARARGAFASIIPVRDADGTVLLDQDETIRSGVTAEKLASLPPVFRKVGTQEDVDDLLKVFPDLKEITHVHHAGNAPAMADGAALVLLAGEESAKRHGLTPRARILATAEANVAITQTGAVDASRRALQRAGLTAQDIELWEVRDSFAAVTLHYARAFDLDLDVFNVNGSSIALGHPMGATGAMLVGTLLDEMDARDLRYGLVAIAGAAGVASAAVIERINS